MYIMENKNNSNKTMFNNLQICSRYSENTKIYYKTKINNRMTHVNTLHKIWHTSNSLEAFPLIKLI